MNIAQFLFGWLTPKSKAPKVDSYPAGQAETWISAKRYAARWYQGQYGSAPKVPCVVVEVVPQSRIPGQWAATVSAHRILLSQSCPTGSVLHGVAEHEMRHAVAMYNGKPYGEEDIQ